MKKLLILATAVCAVVGVQAASVNWLINGDDTTENYLVYLVGSISSDWTSVADLEKTAKAFGSGSTTGYSGKITDQGRSYDANGVLSSPSISKTKAEIYFVLVKDSTATSYSYVMKDLATYVYEGSDTSTGTFDSLDATTDFTNSGTFATGGGDDPSGVPEPTSAMLVLVGLAGLALKRKNA